MAATTSASPLLALPLELRTKVYEQLLVPENGSVQVIYHDRRGRSQSSDYHPAIIHANRQIHDEAMSVLYDRFVFRIELTTPVVQQCTGGYYSDRERSLGMRRPLIHEPAEAIIIG